MDKIKFPDLMNDNGLVYNLTPSITTLALLCASKSLAITASERRQASQFACQLPQMLNARPSSFREIQGARMLRCRGTYPMMEGGFPTSVLKYLLVLRH
ncbi:hypothetical protein BJY00DRAFT_72077 [Aspergillus carlsbadensis]|nr:hypothetical protein BJY00DRAFT_72077 [Aspergillus carlsbadensis]